MQSLVIVVCACERARATLFRLCSLAEATRLVMGLSGTYDPGPTSREKSEKKDTDLVLYVTSVCR